MTYTHGGNDQLPPITLPSTNPVANTITIITHAFKNPNQPLVLEEPKTAPPQAGRPDKFFGTGFFWLLLIVMALTVACGVVELVLAWAWTDSPTHFQEQAFATFDWGFKDGLPPLISWALFPPSTPEKRGRTTRGGPGRPLALAPHPGPRPRGVLVASGLPGTRASNKAACWASRHNPRAQAPALAKLYS